MGQARGRSQRRSGGERKSREERWPELLEVATQVFYEKGYDAASLQDIADRLGMLKGSLYYYIESKENLLYEVIDEVHREGLANVEALTAREGSPLERLHIAIVGHIEHECRTIVKTSVFLHELDTLDPERQRQILGDEPAYRRVFSDLLAEGQAQGQIRKSVDPKLGSLWILGSLNWVYRWFKSDSGFTAHQIGEQFADLIVAGLAESAPAAGIDRISSSSHEPSGESLTATDEGNESPPDWTKNMSWI